MKNIDGFIKIDGREATFIAKYSTQFENDSFDHAFGTHECGHDELDEVEITSLIYSDDDDCDEIEETPEILESVKQEIARRL